jgi:hypothetical protein
MNQTSKLMCVFCESISTRLSVLLVCISIIASGNISAQILGVEINGSGIEGQKTEISSSGLNIFIRDSCYEGYMEINPFRLGSSKYRFFGAQIGGKRYVPVRSNRKYELFAKINFQFLRAQNGCSGMIKYNYIPLSDPLRSCDTESKEWYLCGRLFLGGNVQIKEYLHLHLAIGAGVYYGQSHYDYYSTCDTTLVEERLTGWDYNGLFTGWAGKLGIRCYLYRFNSI